MAEDVALDPFVPAEGVVRRGAPDGLRAAQGRPVSAGDEDAPHGFVSAAGRGASPRRMESRP